jgi:hypothetical protein
MVESKFSRNVHLASYPTVGHGVLLTKFSLEIYFS